MNIGDKIKLIMDLPIDRKHGATNGEVFAITRFQQAKKKKRQTGGLGLLVYFTSKDGSECGAYEHEYEVI